MTTGAKQTEAGDDEDEDADDNEDDGEVVGEVAQLVGADGDCIQGRLDLVSNNLHVGLH